MDREKTGSVLFCSTKFAESFDLFTALNGYHLGFDWNFEVNEQADGRMARGEKAFANSHYVVSKETVDTYMLEVLNNKKRVSTATFKDYMNL